MNMTLSKRGDYVMRAAIFLAGAPAGVTKKIREVVADTEVPPAFASQILSDLVRAGLATSKAGRGGGYQLSRDASLITALEIVEAAEGPLAAERCALGEGPCKWDTVCPLHDTWFEATHRVRELLAATTLAELAQRDLQIADGTYSPVGTHRRNPRQTEVRDAVQIERNADQVAATLGSSRIAVAEMVGRSVTEDGSGESGDIETDGAVQPVRTTGSTSLPRTFQVVWRVRDSEHACHVEADLEVVTIDADRCELRLSALWHQEGGQASASDVERRAQRTIRLFLRELAMSLEGTTIAAASREP